MANPEDQARDKILAVAAGDPNAAAYRAAFSAVSTLQGYDLDTTKRVVLELQHRGVLSLNRDGLLHLDVRSDDNFQFCLRLVPKLVNLNLPEGSNDRDKIRRAAIKQAIAEQADRVEQAAHSKRPPDPGAADPDPKVVASLLKNVPPLPPRASDRAKIARAREVEHIMATGTSFSAPKAGP